MKEFRINENKGVELGIYTLGDLLPPHSTENYRTEHQRIKEMVAMPKLVEDAGLDVFGVGESHQKLFVASSAPTILATIAGVTKR